MLHPYVSRRNTGIIMNGICNDRVYSNVNYFLKWGRTMIEWISNNWKELLGTGGIGVIIVAVLNFFSKSKIGSKNKQNIKTGNDSDNYQANGNIIINERKSEEDNGK